LAITHIAVIDTSNGAVQPDSTVIIAQTRLAALGISGKVRIPKNAEIIDGSGKFLIPGLWDMHVHTSQLGQDLLPMFIANGVTGVRDMHSSWSAFEQIRAWNGGAQAWPRIVASGPGIDGPGSPKHGVLIVRNAAEARESVMLLKQRGAAFVKIYEMLSRESYDAIASQAAKEGLPFVGHLPLSVTIAEVLTAGQRSIEHCFSLLAACSPEPEIAKQAAAIGLAPPPERMSFWRARSERVIARYSSEHAKSLGAARAKNGVWIDPTLTVDRMQASLDDAVFLGRLDVKYMPQAVQARWKVPDGVLSRYFFWRESRRGRVQFAKELEALRIVYRAGARILPGTDTPVRFCLPGFGLHDELALLVQAGLTPTEALRAATRDAAEALNLAHEYGTVTAGKAADLVVLDANPLQDIHNLKAIYGVVLRGNFIPRGRLDTMLADIEKIARQPSRPAAGVGRPAGITPPV